MLDDLLYSDPELAQFYDCENRWDRDFDFCADLAKNAKSVLDLGCGTGELAAALSESSQVTGVDPAQAMLKVARQRPGGARVTWIEADARTLRLERRFDLILLTGHAFQVFLSLDDQRAVLDTIARHLSAHGRFVFDSRNPTCEAWKGWNPEQSGRRIHHAQLGGVEVWNESAHDPESGIVTYKTHFRITKTGRTLSAASRIRFTPKHQLEPLIEGTGLTVDRWMGDWEGQPWHPHAAEIIPIGHLR